MPAASLLTLFPQALSIFGTTRKLLGDRGTGPRAAARAEDRSGRRRTLAKPPQGCRKGFATDFPSVGVGPSRNVPGDVRP